MNISDVSLISRAEAWGSLETIESLVDKEAFNRSKMLEQATIDLGHGVGESYDNPRDTGTVLNTRLFNALNTLWHIDIPKANQSSGVTPTYPVEVSPIISLSLGMEVDWNSRALRTFDGPAISEPIVLERWVENPDDEEVTSRLPQQGKLGLRTRLGSVGLAGWDIDKGPTIRSEPEETQVDTLEDIISYQADLITLRGLYEAFGLNFQSAIFEEGNALPSLATK